MRMLEGRGHRTAVRCCAMLLLMSPGACTSPPSVTPLLRVAEQAVREEARRLEADVARDTAQVESVRRSLSAAYDADLAQRETLTPAWVREATDVYVAAREALVRHELTLAAERRTRAANLDAAADATARAAAILERQDALITRALDGHDLWRLKDRPTMKEASR